MRVVVALIVAMILAPIVAWFVMAGICSIPGLRYSNACGHNAYVWMIIVGPISYIALGIGVYRLIREDRGRSEIRSGMQ